MVSRGKGIWGIGYLGIGYPGGGYTLTPLPLETTKAGGMECFLVI